jgi:tRNA-specific 2-thiouridylase
MRSEEIAEENNFINYDKKDSVGICFVGERNLRDFLKEIYLI